MRLRFPARTTDFDRGVEIGIVAALMSRDLTEFTRKISNDNLGQVRALVEQFGYRLIEGAEDEEFVELSFYSRTARRACASFTRAPERPGVGPARPRSPTRRRTSSAARGPPRDRRCRNRSWR